MYGGEKNMEMTEDDIKKIKPCFGKFNGKDVKCYQCKFRRVCEGEIDINEYNNIMALHNNVDYLAKYRYGD